jgi:hypothetical protein
MLPAEFFGFSRYFYNVPSGSLREEMVFHLLVQTAENMVDYRSSAHVPGSAGLQVEPRVFLHPLPIDDFHADMVRHEDEREVDSNEHANRPDRKQRRKKSIPPDERPGQDSQKQEVQHEFPVFAVLQYVAVRKGYEIEVQ